MSHDWAVANARAERLLLSFLTPSQQHDFEQYARFTVIGNKTGRAYRIDCTRQNGNVTTDKTRHCAVLLDEPLLDQCLVQKLLIENDENLFLLCAVNDTRLDVWPEVLDVFAWSAVAATLMYGAWCMVWVWK